jgi:hypothetical protein
LECSRAGDRPATETDERNSDEGEGEGKEEESVIWFEKDMEVDLGGATPLKKMHLK